MALQSFSEQWTQQIRKSNLCARWALCNDIFIFHSICCCSQHCSLQWSNNVQPAYYKITCGCRSWNIHLAFQRANIDIEHLFTQHEFMSCCLLCVCASASALYIFVFSKRFLFRFRAQNSFLAHNPAVRIPFKSSLLLFDEKKAYLSIVIPPIYGGVWLAHTLNVHQIEMLIV